MFDATVFVNYVARYLGDEKTIITEEQRRQLRSTIEALMTLDEGVSESESESSDSAVGDEENTGDGMYFVITSTF